MQFLAFSCAGDIPNEMHIIREELLRSLWFVFRRGDYSLLSNHIIRIVTDSCNRKLDQSDLLIWVSGDLPFVRFLRQCYSDNILW